MDSYLFCYHGTIKRDGEEIQRKIDLSKARYQTDFGKGFYVTDNVKQAERWAISRSKDYLIDNKKFPPGAEPVVVYFQIDRKQLQRLAHKRFESPNREWAEFIFECRSAGIAENLYHSFDYTTGPLADGRTNILVRNKIKGKITIDEFLEGIQPIHAKYSQLALHTEAAIRCLKLVGVKELEME